jgi:uncharacterized membrane protein YjfL (UPF0719 family)
MVSLLAALGPVLSDTWVEGLISTIVYAVIGMLLFALSIWLMERLAPFSIRKELEEDQNTALAVLMGSIVLGIAIIFAASIVG